MGKKSTETYPGQRQKEKREFFKRFRHPAIEGVFKDRFYALFNRRCFKCGVPEQPSGWIGRPLNLCIDHHVPMALGGHLIPGNLVALCRRCNGVKLDRPPDLFYTPDELLRLVPLLEQQEALFAFKFDLKEWCSDRGAYLLSIGVPPDLVYELLSNPNHPYYVPPESEGTGVVISVDAESLEFIVQELSLRAIPNGESPTLKKQLGN